MLSLISMCIGLFVVIMVVGYFTGNHRFRRRLKARLNEAVTTVSNSVGDTVDDMNEAISERKAANQNLMSKLAVLKAQISRLQEQHKLALSEAAKFGKLAEIAVGQGSDEDAMKMLNLQSEQEAKSVSLLKEVEGLEAAYNEVHAVLTSSMSEVEKAEQDKQSFAARHASIAMREEMTDCVASFGGQGKLDFSGITGELEQREAVLNAKNAINDSVDGKDVVKRLEASVANEVVKNRLEALKQKAGK